jgi:alcohol oxidase
MMYTRAQDIDFDSWNTEGWAAKDMREMCKKLETFHPAGEEFDRERHGYDGPVHISDGGYRGKSEKQFLDTVKGMGYKEVADLQDGEACGGFGVSGLSFLVLDGSISCGFRFLWKSEM